MTSPHAVRVAITTVLLLFIAPAGLGQTSSNVSAATLREAGGAKNLIVGAASDPAHLGETAYASTLANQFRQLEPRTR